MIPNTAYVPPPAVPTAQTVPAGAPQGYAPQAVPQGYAPQGYAPAAPQSYAPQGNVPPAQGYTQPPQNVQYVQAVPVTAVPQVVVQQADPNHAVHRGACRCAQTVINKEISCVQITWFIVLLLLFWPLAWLYVWLLLLLF